ncbi:MAG: TatD family deoxyribonuclease [Ruminococcaceae bacterium]|nr:TatD family deoxyribonuclease [Oscillospiraceae bacterium]
MGTDLAAVPFLGENMTDILDNLDCTGLFDSHAHYFDIRFEDRADEILQNNVFGKGFSGVINVGTNKKNSLVCIEQAAKYQGMYVAAGIHPEEMLYCKDTYDEELDALHELINSKEKRQQNKIVALGEIGLDYHYEGFDKNLQIYCFEKQLEIAEALDLPVIIHDRDAHGDCFETVIKYKNVRGVFHSFSGSPEMATELVKRGWYISFSGVLTFKNARKAVEAAEVITLDRILIETDCPYLAPHPYRGQLNHSGLMALTAQRLAEIKNKSYKEIVEITRNNAKTLFGIK